jgi:hypothetical protein
MRNAGGSAMYRIIVAAIAVVFVGFPTGSPAQVAAAQIKLTEKHVEGFIAAQRDMSAVAEKMQGSISNHPDAKYEAELNAVTKKHGFKNFAEYEAVAANISLVMAAIDPQTKVFTDPRAAIKKELEEVSANKTIASNEKRKLLRELNEALKSAELIQFPTNIELVTKYYDKIDATTILSTMVAIAIQLRAPCGQSANNQILAKREVNCSGTDSFWSANPSRKTKTADRDANRSY